MQYPGRWGYIEQRNDSLYFFLSSLSSSLLLILPYKEQISRQEDHRPVEAQEANVSPDISTTMTPTEGVLTDLQECAVSLAAERDALRLRAGSNLHIHLHLHTGSIRTSRYL